MYVDVHFRLLCELVLLGAVRGTSCLTHNCVPVVRDNTPFTGVSRNAQRSFRNDPSTYIKAPGNHTISVAKLTIMLDIRIVDKHNSQYEPARKRDSGASGEMLG